ncbi:MAG: helix-turn-helix transcriptional regulator [Pseudomonadota bacterium]
MANEIDAHVGMRLRQRRWMLGLTQQQLGDRVGIKFQQIQKYETGQNRISASRLWDLARVCETPVSYFFEGLGEAGPAQPYARAAKGDPLADREAAELLRSYYAAPPARRRAAFELMRTLSDEAIDETATPGEKAGSPRSAA